MATLGSTQVDVIGLGQPVPLGPFHIEVWRARGGTIGDTATLAPKRGRFIVSAIAGGGPSREMQLGTVGTDTNVVFTLTQSAASTNVTWDTWLLIQE